MKKIITLLFVLSLLSGCKKKSDICYDCYTNDGSGARFDEVVCTDDDPRDELPRVNANGNLSWVCTKR